MSEKQGKLFGLLLVVIALLAAFAWAISGMEAQSTFAPITDPPDFLGYTEINITNNGIPRLETNRDYILNMPDYAITRRMAIVGGRNVVMIGGEIDIRDKSSTASISERNALLVRDSTGTVHIEGLYIHGEDLSEGIQIDAPQARVQIVNVRIENMHARDQVNFSDNHPDCIQTYGNARELIVDGFTCETDYQGIFLSADYDKPHGRVYVRNANILPNGIHGRYEWWISDRSDIAGPYEIENVWVQPSPSRYSSFGESGAFLKSTWPETNRIIGEDAVGRFAEWESSRINGRVYEGIPPAGDFVTRDMVGIDYEREEIPPTIAPTATFPIPPTEFVTATPLPPTLEPTIEIPTVVPPTASPIPATPASRGRIVVRFFLDWSIEIVPIFAPEQ